MLQPRATVAWSWLLQAKANAEAASLAPLSQDVMAATREIYERRIAPHVQHRW